MKRLTKSFGMLLALAVMLIMTADAKAFFPFGRFRQQNIQINNINTPVVPVNSFAAIRTGYGFNQFNIIPLNNSLRFSTFVSPGFSSFSSFSTGPVFFVDRFGRLQVR